MPSRVIRCKHKTSGCDSDSGCAEHVWQGSCKFLQWGPPGSGDYRALPLRRSWRRRRPRAGSALHWLMQVVFQWGPPGSNGALPLPAQLEAASKGKERRAAQAELDRAQARLAKYQERLGGGAGAAGEGTPRVEVGCLEEVIGKMEADTDGEWGNVMFIPKGARQGVMHQQLLLLRCFVMLLWPSRLPCMRWWREDTA